MNRRNLNILLFSAFALSACGEAFIDPLPPRGRIHFPVGMTIHPSGTFLYVVNSNFDTRYREDVGGTVSVVDLSTFKVAPEATPYIPSFASNIELNADASKAYVTVRLDNQLLALDVDPYGGGLSCEGSANTKKCAIARIPNRDRGADIPLDPFGIDVLTVPGEQSVTVSAAEPGVYGLLLSNGNFVEEVSYTALAGDTAESIAGELTGAISALLTFSATQDGTQITIVDANSQAFKVSPTFNDAADSTHTSVNNQNLDIINLTHIRGLNVTTISLPGQSFDAASMQYAELISGANAVARRPGTMDYYAAGRLARDVVVYRPYLNSLNQVQAIFERARIPLNNLVGSVNARAVLFEPDGETLYVVTRNPDALHVIDLGPADAELGTGTLNKVVRSLPLARRPSDIVPHQRLTDGKNLLYIPAYEAKLIQVVDPETSSIVAEIELGARPYDFEIDRGPYCQVGSLDRCLGYVALFDDLPRAGGRCEDNRDKPCGSIGVIDLNPMSPRYHQLVGKIH